MKEKPQGNPRTSLWWNLLLWDSGQQSAPTATQMQWLPIWSLLPVHLGGLQSHLCLLPPALGSSVLLPQTSPRQVHLCREFPTACNVEVPIYHDPIPVRVRDQRPYLTAVWPQDTPHSLYQYSVSLMPVRAHLSVFFWLAACCQYFIC